MERDRLVMDAPVWNHAWILVNWLVFEGVTTSLLAITISAYRSRFSFNPASPCVSFTYNCKQAPAPLALLCTLFAAWFLWIFLWMYYIFRALSDLSTRPWQRYRMANTTARVQLRARLYSQIMFCLCVALLAFAQPYSCGTYVQTWLGFSPMMVMETTMTLGMVFYFMPKTPELRKPMLQLWRQEFSWTEAKKAERIALRNQRLSVLNDKAVLEEPMFCFETAVKAFYWTALIYMYEEEAGVVREGKSKDESEGAVGEYTLETAMDLWNLERFELLVEPAEDTKVLCGWNSDTIVIAFRGTASITNVLADLRLWRTPHPPKRGSWLLGQQPVVHSGFLASWNANGLNLRVLDRVRDILHTPGADLENMRILLTGHSLGGAQATLAAVDIAREFKDLLSKQQVVVYPFGAPRTGNHAFAREYNLWCPDTWHIINDRDIVPRSGKLICLYKRSGQRVLINSRGDMLVRPAFVEMTAQTMPFRSSVQHHFLASYQAAFLAICSVQFGEKALSDGVEGMGKLVSSGEVRDVLSKGYLDSAKAERFAAIGGRALWQLGAIGDQMTRAVGIPAGDAKEAKAPKGRLKCHDGVCWREPEDGLTTEDGSIGWLRNKSKISLDKPDDPSNPTVSRTTAASQPGLYESRTQVPVNTARISMSRAQPGNLLTSSRTSIFVPNDSSAASEVQQAQDAGPRSARGAQAGRGPSSTDQLAEHEAATQGTAGVVGIPLPAAAAAGVVKEAKAPDEKFLTCDMDELAREFGGGAREQDDPGIFAEAFMQRFAPAMPAAHKPNRTFVETAGGAESQACQPEAQVGGGREGDAAGSSADACSEQPFSINDSADAAGSQAESASTSTARDSRTLEGREADGVQQIASGAKSGKDVHGHHSLHLPHFKLPHFHLHSLHEAKSNGSSLGDPTASWDISSQRSSGPQNAHSQGLEEKSGQGELRASRRDNHYMAEENEAAEEDVAAQEPWGSSLYRPSKDAALTASRRDHDDDVDAGRKDSSNDLHSRSDDAEAAASSRQRVAGEASDRTANSGRFLASQDSWHSATLEEKIRLMASEGVLSEALQQSQDRHLNSQESWARRHLLGLPRRGGERAASLPRKERDA